MIALRRTRRLSGTYPTKGIPNKQVESFDGQAEDILADSAFAFY
jgi:hypothetical protein